MAGGLLRRRAGSPGFTRPQPGRHRRYETRLVLLLGKDQSHPVMLYRFVPPSAPRQSEPEVVMGRSILRRAG